LNYIRWDGGRTLGGKGGWKSLPITEMDDGNTEEITALLVYWLLSEMKDEIKEQNISCEFWTVIEGVLDEPSRIAVR